MPTRLRTLAAYSVCVLIGVLSLSTLIAEDEPVAKAPEAKTPEAKAPAGDAGPTYKLAYKFQKGGVVRYETLNNAKFVSQFKGTEEVATNKTQTRKIYRVLSVNGDGSAELELIIEWVRMKVDFGGGGLPIEFDSKDPAAKSQAKFADVLKNVGKPQARLQCAPNGKVNSIRELSLVQLKDVAGSKDFDFLTVFPDEPIAVGNSWIENSEIKVTVEDNLKESIKLQRKYTLVSVEGDIATVAFKTSVLTPVKNPTISIQLIQRETSGKLKFDMAKGAMVTRNVDSDKSVINPAGNNTAMHATSYLLEQMVISTADISEAPTGKVNK